MEKKKSGAVTETVRTVAYAVVIALAVRTFAFEPFNIPSGSMIPTLLVGDYLFVSKYSYGYSRYSLPWSLPLIDGRLLGRAPERGDVVVFKLPKDNKTDYIKRMIGLPGEMTPDGMTAQIDISLTDDYPLAQAIVIISAVPGSDS